MNFLLSLHDLGDRRAGGGWGLLIYPAVERGRERKRRRTWAGFLFCFLVSYGVEVDVLFSSLTSQEWLLFLDVSSHELMCGRRDGWMDGRYLEVPGYVG